MYKFRVALSSWTPTLPIKIAASQIEAFCEALTQVNMAYLSHHEVPLLYKSGLKYEKDSADTFSDIPTILKAGVGDCEDLCAYRVAELRLFGEHRARCVALFQRNDNNRPLPYNIHILVMRKNGALEDPSKLLGMKP